LLIFVNKLDDSKFEEDYTTFLKLSGLSLPCIGGSVRRGRNLMDLLKVFYEMAGIIRVYTRAPGKDADLTAPFVLPEGSPLEELARRIYKDFVNKLKFAKVWGKAVYDGQMVQRDHVLEDGDIVEIRI
jgi:ribosome-interacting GTPase 1